jgi:Ribbon-helix-helix protein, copG family
MGTGNRGDVGGKAMSADRPQGLIEGSGRRGEPRRLDQMVSARLDPTLVATLKQLAERRGMSLSDVLREAALLLLRREEAQNVITFRVDVTSERTGGVSHESFRQDIEVPA